MDLSIITVTWNSVDFIEEQIKSVALGAEGISYEHLIYDNDSSDGTVALIRRKYPDFKLIAGKSNIGFGAACNTMFAEAAGDFILLLNPDMKVEAGSLKKLLEIAKTRPNLGIVSAKLLDEKGKFNRTTAPRRFPTLVDQLMVLLKIPHLFPGILDHYLFVDFNENLDQQVDSVQGSFMLVSRSFLKKLGRLFDPAFFIWFEDVDLCREALRLGFEVWYTPQVEAIDYSGRSFKKQPLFWKQKMLTNSMLQYFRKWRPWYETFVIAITRPFVLLMAWTHDAFFGL